MAVYVLVHGAYHDGACWGAVGARLRANGHSVHAPTLPGHADGDSVDVSHAHYVDRVVDEIERDDVADVILVGHSMGGSVVAKVAELIPGRISRLVLVAGMVLTDGQRIVDELPASAKTAVLQALLAGRPTVLPLFDAVYPRFFRTVSREKAHDLYARFWRPQPVAPLLDRVSMASCAMVDVPVTYIIGRHDRRGETLDEDWHPHFSRRLTQPRIVRLPTDHEAMLTDPASLATSLLEEETFTR